MIHLAIILSLCSESDHSAISSGHESDTSHGKIIANYIASYMIIAVVYSVTMCVFYCRGITTDQSKVQEPQH